MLGATSATRLTGPNRILRITTWAGVVACANRNESQRVKTPRIGVRTTATIAAHQKCTAADDTEGIPRGVDDMASPNVHAHGRATVVDDQGAMLQARPGGACC